MTSALSRSLALLAFLAPGSALASVTMGGGTAFWEVNYGTCGTWWNGSDGLVMEDPSTSSSSYGDNDFVSASDPWTQVTLEFDYGGSSYAYDNNDGTGSCDWTMSYEYADSAVGYHFFSAGPIDVIRYESLRLTWALTGGGVPIDRGTDHIVWYEVWNQGATDATDVQLMVALDPDVDVALGGSGSTLNDVENVDTSDGYADWAGAVGNTGMTIGFAPCDPGTASIGFGSRTTSADTTLSDPGGAQSDSAVYFIQDIGTLGAGQAASFGFVLGMGSDDALTRDYAVDGAAGNMSFEYCDCDEDADGFSGVQCGGSDCDDSDAAINPGATEVWYDGVDSDCNDWDDYDADRDGHAHDGYGGDDCDDTDPDVHPGAEELWYDGVDQDCDDSTADDDQDGDGHPRDEDCDDTDGSVWDGCEEDDGDDDSGDPDIDGDGSGLGDGDRSAGVDDWKTTGGHGGCGCASTAPQQGSWAVGLLALVGTLVRRRR